MMRKPWALATVVAAGALALAACSKQADTQANAPGSPGTGSNPTEVVRPAMPDGPAPQAGSSGGEAVPGTTGSGTTGSTSHAQPGVGTDGGLASSSVMGSSPSPGISAAGNGSSNATSGTAVGSRP